MEKSASEIKHNNVRKSGGFPSCRANKQRNTVQQHHGTTQTTTQRYMVVQVYETTADHPKKAFVVYQTYICRQVAGNGTWPQAKSCEINSNRFGQIQTIVDNFQQDANQTVRVRWHLFPSGGVRRPWDPLPWGSREAQDFGLLTLS